MTTEVKMLILATLLGLIQLLLAAAASSTQRSFKWNLSARDVKMPDLQGVPGRVERAYINFMETFAFFASAVLVVTVLKAESSTTALGAQMYFFGRVAYLPVYITGVSVLRTVVWFVATVGIFIVLSGVL